jgi:folate-binding Fe-S cluster repair protein YgfZ
MTPQYRTIAAGAAWLDVSARGRIRFDGPDAASFLHALVTNDVADIPAGRGAYTAWLTPQGRMITDLRVLRDDGRIVAEVPEGLAAPVATRFDQLIFSENVRVFDDTASTRQVVVFGEQAARVVGVAGPPLRSADLPGPVISRPAISGYSHRRSGIAELFDLDARQQLGCRHGRAEENGRRRALFDALRVGRPPSFWVDMTTDTIARSGLLNRAISMTKGCYVGREVIVRSSAAVVAAPGSSGGGRGETAVPTLELRSWMRARVGAITSAALGPATGRVVALGYVHRDSAQAGRRLALGSGQEVVVG